MEINNYCAICGKPIINSMKKITCSRECQRKYQKIYNLIYGGLYRRFNGK